jgi:competence protein ComEA
MHKKSGLLISLIGLSIQAACIDLNQADIKELIQSLPRIGTKKAQEIVQYRRQHHYFSSIYELAAVKGIGEHYIERYHEQIVHLCCPIP